MPHIHEKIDFTVTVYVVHDGKVLFIKHKKLGIWLPVGGHVELDEDPEAAAIREAEEESGLQVELVGERPDIEMTHGRMLLAPRFMDIHAISPTHQHVDMVYFGQAKTDQVVLDAAEHDAIRWLTFGDLDDPVYSLLPNIRFYAQEALKAVQ